jgi:serine/threonine-protein kinase
MMEVMSDGTADATDANLGLVLGGKYQLVRLLGKGGMGAVYEGRNQIGKRVAVKLLLDPSFTSNHQLTTRFFREAQASAAVESKHVVDVYDTGVDQPTGYPFIIMAFLPGEDLEHVVRRVGALNPTAATRIVSQAASGIAKAHAAGIVHRDIKPANLFLALDDNELTVKVLDFGIAKVDAQRLGDGQGLTHTGALLGTPLYMSPEQAQGLKSVDARTDIWSLGMCLYHALAGRLPFEDVDTIGKLIVSIVARDLTPLATLAPWVAPELAAVVHRALDRDPDKRLQSARDLIAQLQPFTGGSTVVTTSSLTGVSEALDATLAPGANMAPVAITPPSTPTGARTTAGVANESQPSTPKPRSRVLWPALGAAGVGIAVLAAVFGRSHEEPRSRPSAATAAAHTSSEPAPQPQRADNTTKHARLRLKIPKGYAVTVDGNAPGSPGNVEAPKPVEQDTLELQGEFQQKFLVAVHDTTGARVMMQDVYMYDNRLDPETIDSKIGPVKVEKPKRDVDASGTKIAGSASTKPAGDLPPRF